MSGEPRYPYVDCIWIARDALGKIGAFVTAGEGPIPVAALREQAVPFEEIEDRLLELPHRCEATMLSVYPKPDSFMALGMRGIFVFDWTDVHRTRADEIGVYEKVCRPSNSLRADELDSQLRECLHALSPLGTDFGILATVDPRSQEKCLQP